MSVHLDEQFDYSSYDGAHEQAHLVRAFWAKHGYTIETQVVHIAGGSNFSPRLATFGVRSNLRNGLPPGMLITKGLLHNLREVFASMERANARDERMRQTYGKDTGGHERRRARHRTGGSREAPPHNSGAADKGSD